MKKKKVFKELGDLVEYEYNYYRELNPIKIKANGIIIATSKDLHIINGFAEITGNQSLIALKNIKVIKKHYLNKEQMKYLRGELK